MQSHAYSDEQLLLDKRKEANTIQRDKRMNGTEGNHFREHLLACRNSQNNQNKQTNDVKPLLCQPVHCHQTEREIERERGRTAGLHRPAD